MTPKPKILISLVTLFALGIACGAVLGNRWQAGRTPSPAERWQPLTLADYEERLQLTPEQIAAFKPVFRETGKQLQKLRADTVVEIRAVLRGMDDQIARDLTPQQRAQLENIRHRKAP